VAIYIKGGSIGAFPSNTAVIDDFNRTDSLVYAGAGGTIWQNQTVTSGAGILAVQSNALKVLTSAGSQCISVNSFGPDVDFYFTVPTKDASSYLAFYFAFTTDSGSFPGGSGNPFHGYGLVIGLAGTDVWDLRNYEGASGSSLGSVTQTWSSGDRIGVSMRAGVLAAYLDTGSGWTLVLSQTDGSATPHNQAGRVGFEFGSATFAVDNLSGGTAVVVGGQRGGISARTVRGGDVDIAVERGRGVSPHVGRGPKFMGPNPLYTKLGRVFRPGTGHGFIGRVDEHPLLPAGDLLPDTLLLPDYIGNLFTKAGRSIRPTTVHGLAGRLDEHPLLPAEDLLPDTLLLPDVEGVEYDKTGRGISPRTIHALISGSKTGRGIRPAVARGTGTVTSVETGRGIRPGAARATKLAYTLVKAGRGRLDHAGTGYHGEHPGGGAFVRIGGFDISRCVVAVERVSTEYELEDVTGFGDGVHRTLPGRTTGTFAVTLLVDGVVIGPAFWAALRGPPIYVEIWHRSFQMFTGFAVPTIGAEQAVEDAAHIVNLELKAVDQVIWSLA